MQSRKPLRFLFMTVIILAANVAVAKVSIFISENATEMESLAANELQSHLSQIYPSEAFSISKDGSERSGAQPVYVGTLRSQPEFVNYIDVEELEVPESYVVTKAIVKGQEAGIILGADETGLLYGVYGLLEQLGCGFFLSFDTLPVPMKDFTFDRWDIANHPLTPIRMVFNWHNFLSGCSGWDLEHWKKWITQSQKCGYNTVMVHAYGNNPMFTFKFKGKTKPVGYLTTTQRGRDWSVNHVNDVRRLHGGFLFDEPVFGSEAGKGPEDKLVQVKQSMMYKAFEHAQQRGVKVNFALDFDIPSCNPQDMILLLDPSDRFKIRGTWVARPDTPGGYAYYKAQAKSLTDTYPQIDTVTLWRRYAGYTGATWPVMKKGEMPKAWQAEYEAIVKAEPETAKLFQSSAAFGMAKVAKAWRKALNELGKEDIELAAGSWKFPWLPAAAKFFPKDVKLIPLDSEVARGKLNLRNEKLMQDTDEAVEDGRMIPIIWAHHDDGEYTGAPLRVHKRFNSSLKTWGAGGFGIIHWMTHPLDIYFTSHSRQTWSVSADEPLDKTCAWAAERYFGTANKEVMAEYLNTWMTDMPFFGRETGDFFIDRPMKKHAPLDETVSGCRDRIELLDKADRTKMNDMQAERHQFFTDYEQFVFDLFETQYRFEAAESAYKSGQLGRARELILICHPEELVARYAKALQNIGITRGEEGLIVTMNTRWIPHYVRFRQKVGLEPVRFNYAGTSHDDLAQSPGHFTFHVTPDKALWQTFGNRETGANVFTIPEAVNIQRGDDVPSGYEEICRSGIESDKPISIILSPILPRGSRGGLSRDPLPAGTYKLSLMMAEPTACRAGERVMNLEIDLPGGSAPKRYAFSPVKTKYLRLLCQGNSENDWNSIYEITAAAIDKSVPVRASGAENGQAAALAIDGDPKTRWAAQGEQWIQFATMPDLEMDHIEINWYGGDRLEAFDIQISDDAKIWKTIEYTEVVKTQAPKTDTIDIYKRAGDKNCAVVLDYPITLSEPGTLTVNLRPVRGEALICGIILEPTKE